MHKTNLAARASAEPFYARNDESTSSAGLLAQLLDDAIDQQVRTVHLEQEADFCRVRKRVNGRLDETRFDSPTLVPELLGELAHIRNEPCNSTDTFTTTVRHRRADCHVVCHTFTATTGLVLTIEISHPANIPETLEQTALSAVAIKTLRANLAKKAGGITVVSSPCSDLLCTLYYPLMGEHQHLETKIMSFEFSQRKDIPRVNQITTENPQYTATADADHVFIDWRRSRHTELVNTILEQYVSATIFIQTTDSAHAIRQLTDLAISERQLASNLSHCIALDHAHLVCPHCAEAHTPNKTEIDRMEQLGISADSTLNDAPGCDRCGFTGAGEHRILLSLCEANDKLRQSIESRSAAAISKALASILKKRSIREQSKALISSGQMSLHSQA